jgi:hypothetical protein
MIDQVFGRLTVVSRAYSTNKNSFWRCRCLCGNEKVVMRANLLNGHAQSCGCLRSETIRKSRTKHGYADTRLWVCWRNMHARIRKKTKLCYQHVTICEEWHDYMNFHKWALANGYADNLTIDRINGDLGYSPENCRWATWLQQRHNRRSSSVQIDVASLQG